MSSNDDENATPEKLKVHHEKPMRTRQHSEETRRKLSIAQKGKRHSEETLRKMSESHMGHTPWNKGRKGVYSEETLKKISKSLKGRTSPRKVKKSTGRI